MRLLSVRVICSGDVDARTEGMTWSIELESFRIRGNIQLDGARTPALKEFFVWMEQGVAIQGFEKAAEDGRYLESGHKECFFV